MGFFKSLFARRPAPLAGSPAFNDAVRAQLADSGDEGLRARHVLHYAYPETKLALMHRPRIIEGLKRKGFQVSDGAGDGLILEQYRAVAADNFDALTADLSAWLAVRQLEYNGWECAVVSKVDAA